MKKEEPPYDKWLGRKATYSSRLSDHDNGYMVAVMSPSLLCIIPILVSHHSLMFVDFMVYA
jgi:hypothetical protein